MNVRYFMRKRERYKHLLNLFANFVMLVAETAMFAFIWYKMYVPELEDKFWNRGKLGSNRNVCIGIVLFYPYIWRIPDRIP